VNRTRGLTHGNFYSLWNKTVAARKAPSLSLSHTTLTHSLNPTPHFFERLDPAFAIRFLAPQNFSSPGRRQSAVSSSEGSLLSSESSSWAVVGAEAVGTTAGAPEAVGTTAGAPEAAAPEAAGSVDGVPEAAPEEPEAAAGEPDAAMNEAAID